ncbi:NADP-dependent oxidoreductase [Bacteroides sp. 51]|uniref:NADP-dependent oxidoreductase n=1 Tax=Bacteroides sp. 51 TaxID=2302938 RepID=UPI0013D2CB77|nr:NADP-dependent oxidoreductase [Bacteroides sp. 51]NDV81275.1 NADP-dependent oxidoreductase [Bacteroides sp. 51]
MNSIRLHDSGSSEALRFEKAPIPEISTKQILVKVYATSVNHIDILKASGKLGELHFPWIPGHDFAGVVENVGEKVKGFKVGDKVYGNCNGGSYAEYLVADMNKTAKMPDNLSFVEASSVPHVAETAWQAVHTHGTLRAGQKVLIHGAAGAVGAYAVQFAHQIGAFVYATASGGDKDFVKSLGADVVIDYKKEDFTQIATELKLVIDLVGGETQRRSFPLLVKGGRLVSTVSPIPEDEAEKYFVMGTFMYIQQSAKELKVITRMINDGQIKTDVAAVYPLKEAAKAWDSMLGKDITASTKPHGKFVLEVVDTPDREDVYGKDTTSETPLGNAGITGQRLRSQWREGE